MLSAVIVTYNSEACVASCIAAFARWLPGAEILVVDNASTDASRAVAEAHGATVVGLERNLGFGRACNVGARQAAHEHLLFLNPDLAICEADPQALAELLAAPVLGLAVPTSQASTFLYPERSCKRETLFLALRALRPRELPGRTERSGATGVVWASGAALLLRRSEFLDVGGFDPSYFLYYEDRDLSWRYRRRGLPIRTTPALVADHVGGGSSELSDRRANIGAFAVMGWIQYLTRVGGPDAAGRSWRLMRHVNTAVARSVWLLARVFPSTRLRRKSLQLAEVSQELQGICESSGVLEQSDGHEYWPEAVAVLRELS
jgi:GT2 family glycosyltransferase